MRKIFRKEVVSVNSVIALSAKKWLVHFSTNQFSILTLFSLSSTADFDFSSSIVVIFLLIADSTLFSSIVAFSREDNQDK